MHLFLFCSVADRGLWRDTNKSYFLTYKTINMTMMLRIFFMAAALVGWTAGFSAHPVAINKNIHRQRMPALPSFDVMALNSMEGVNVAASFSATALTQQASAAINSFFQTQPYLAAFLTCSVKASAADLLAQTQEDNATLNEAPMAMTQQYQDDDDAPLPVDVSRNLGFLLYGGLYSGITQNYLYSVIYPLVIGTDDSLVTLCQQVAVDNLVSAPLLCLPVAYIFKSAFTSSKGLSWDATIQQGLEKYVKDVRYQGLLLKYWTLWVPVQFLTFGVIPPHFRVTFVAAISFFWICILSTIAASETQEQTI
uniref:Uncharacterized protein n=1 Tax=Entomoneis paludosa TaxID=265537 RepID=A0A7S2Y6W9_9STRA